MPKRAVLLAIAVALLAAAPATAAPRTQAAAAYADAALRAQVAMNAQRDEHRARVRAVRFRLCVRALDAIPQGNVRRIERAVNVFVVAILRPMADAFVPVGQRLVADLDAVPTRDAALIAGREAWREIVGIFEGIPAIDRPCERLDEWRRSGWAPAKAPPPLADLTEQLEGDDPAGTNRALARAVRRLRRLGVSRGAAERFRGERFFDGLVDGDPFLSSGARR